LIKVFAFCIVMFQLGSLTTKGSRTAFEKYWNQPCLCCMFKMRASSSRIKLQIAGCANWSGYKCKFEKSLLFLKSWNECGQNSIEVGKVFAQRIRPQNSIPYIPFGMCWSIKLPIFDQRSPPRPIVLRFSAMMGSGAVCNGQGAFWPAILARRRATKQTGRVPFIHVCEAWDQQCELLNLSRSH